METAKDITDLALYRAKNMKEFVVERDMSKIPFGSMRYSIQHTIGRPARIFVTAMNQEEAERLVDKWIN